MKTEQSTQKSKLSEPKEMQEPPVSNENSDETAEDEKWLELGSQLLLEFINTELEAEQNRERLLAKDPEWVVTAPPRRFSDRWYEANHADIEWKVSLSDDRVTITQLRCVDIPEAALPFTIPRDDIPTLELGRSSFARVDDGWLAGFDAGEWGGALLWFDPSGKRHYIISYDQVCGFIESGAGLLALEGLCHLGVNRGQLLVLKRAENSRWGVARFVDLEAQPEVACVDKHGAVLVATTASLLRVTPDRRIQSIVDRAFWEGLSPNSMVSDSSGTIYLGMRYGVARVRESGRNQVVEWLVPHW
jgi:hypothetical protein